MFCGGMFNFYNNCHLFIDDREACSVPVDHPGEDGVRRGRGVADTAKVEGNANEFLHLSVVLCPHLLQ